MSGEDDKIVSLEERRAREDERKAAARRSEQEAERRRRLAEHGPAGVRTGRIIGRVLAILILLIAVSSLALWLWSLIPKA
jgi:hypothetical protein